jgi:hypothetical protein
MLNCRTVIEYPLHETLAPTPNFQKAKTDMETKTDLEIKTDIEIRPNLEISPDFRTRTTTYHREITYGAFQLQLPSEAGVDKVRLSGWGLIVVALPR